jgi:hypothetical protein
MHLNKRQSLKNVQDGKKMNVPGAVLLTCRSLRQFFVGVVRLRQRRTTVLWNVSQTLFFCDVAAFVVDNNSRETQSSQCALWRHIWNQSTKSTDGINMIIIKRINLHDYYKTDKYFLVSCKEQFYWEKQLIFSALDSPLKILCHATVPPLMPGLYWIMSQKRVFFQSKHAGLITFK